MLKSLISFSNNRSSVFLLVLALIVGGVGAQATGLLKTKSGGYLVCVNSATKIVTHPGTSKCPKGSKKLILGAQGAAGVNGLTGAAGLSGRDGIDGVNGKTLWNGTIDPLDQWGAAGDFYINYVSKTLFGPKSYNQSWPAGVSLVGPKGDQGPIGLTGLIGLTGAKGDQGPIGLTGATGAQGPGGGSGPAGAAGSNATLICAQGGTCALGDTGPGGGKVFYISPTPNTPSTPWRYMEAAPDNTWSGGSADPSIKWCSNVSEFVPNLQTGDTATIQTSTAIGAGYANTQKMLLGCTFGAANAAAAYNGGGKSDWFLPSKDELNQMCKWVRGVAWTSDATVCTGGTLNTGLGAAGFGSGLYWSSVESDAGNPSLAWSQSSQQRGYLKVNPLSVRPVRAF